MREPKSAATVVLVLACGVGLSVAIFTTASTVLRRPLPVLDEQRIVVLWGQAGESMRTLPLTPEHFDHFRHETRALQDVAGTVAIDSWLQPVRDGTETFRINLAPVSGNFFRVLGASVAVGRALAPGDDQPGAAPVAVISSSLWHGRFAGSPTVLGRQLALRSGRVTTIVGVAAPGLEYPTGAEMWVPFSTTWVPEVTPIGRLSRTATAQDAAAELRASFARERTSAWRGLRATAVPLPSLIVGDVRPSLLLLSAGAAVLLLAACLNVGNLLLLRGTARQRELAVRRALGAGTGRIVRLLLGETLPLVLLAGALGAWLSTALLRLFVALAPASIPRLEEIRLQGVPLGLAVLVSCAAAVCSGLLPAFWLSGQDGSVLRGSRGTSSSTGTAVTQRALVVFQMALAVFMLFVAGLLGRTLQSLHAIDTGLDADHVMVVELSWPDGKFSNQKVTALYENLLPKLKALPGVTSAATVNVVPFTSATGGWDGRFVAEGEESASPVLNLAVVGAEYFETMGIRIRNGRGFDTTDRRGSVPVAVLSRGAARLLGDEEHILGRRIRFGDAPGKWRTVVGVAPETRYRAIRDSAPTVYIPVAQFDEVASMITTVAVRTTGQAASIGSIRNAVTRTDSDVAVLHAAALRDLVTEQFTGPRFNAVLLGLFAAGAMLLAVVGLYSVLAGSVRTRRRELAIRQTVGATPARLRAMVVTQGLGLCAAGLVAGLFAGFATGRLLGSVLYGITANDPGTVFGAAALLTLASLAAAYWPARQATTPDLTALLRDD
jgi:predicted permease